MGDNGISSSTPDRNANQYIKSWVLGTLYAEAARDIYEHNGSQDDLVWPPAYNKLGISLSRVPSLSEYSVNVLSEDDDYSQKQASQGASQSSAVSDRSDSEVPIHVPTSADDTMIRPVPSQHRDYLTYNWKFEDIWASYRHIVSQRKVYGQTSRLENALWRTWARDQYRLQTFPAWKLNWLREADVTWLYGPLLLAQPSQIISNVTERPSNAHTDGSTSQKRSILKKRTTPQVMRKTRVSQEPRLERVHWKDNNADPLEHWIDDHPAPPMDSEDDETDPLEIPADDDAASSLHSTDDFVPHLQRTSRRTLISSWITRIRLKVLLRVRRMLPLQLLRAVRPKVRAGHQRIEWQCSCDRYMYGDYAKHDAIQRSMLVQALPRYIPESRPSRYLSRFRIRNILGAHSMKIPSLSMSFPLPKFNTSMYSETLTECQR